MKNVVFPVVLLLSAGLSATARGGFMASFTLDGTQFSPPAINVGDTVNVPLYLRHDGMGPNFLEAFGLSSAGIGVGFTPTGIVNVTGGVFGLGWSAGSPSTIFNNSTGAAAILTVAPVGSLITDVGGAILVGTLAFQGVSAGTSVLTLRDPDSGTPNTTALIDSGDGSGARLPVPLDGDIDFSRRASITVNAVNSGVVPEPSSLGLLMIGIAATFMARRCRRPPSSIE